VSPTIAEFLDAMTDVDRGATVIPAGRSGVWGGEPPEVALVEPSLVVEVLADTAQQHGHWHHVVCHLRQTPP
jgi:hypothetical protein